MSLPSLPTDAAPTRSAVPTDAAGRPLLELRDVNAGYGPFRAVFDVSLAIEPGSVLALLGANGAGKTTIARVCTGLVRPTAGRVLFEGDDVSAERVFRITRRGVVHAPEGRSVFASLSVEENLVLTFRRIRERALGELLDEAYTLFPRLGERCRQLAGTLSGGEQRMLSLARVLVNPPRLLVADELSLGLAPVVVDEVYRALADVRARGTALLIVEQHVAHALALADHVAVLVHGRIAHAGPVSELVDLDELLLPGAKETEESGGSAPQS